MTTDAILSGQDLSGAHVASVVTAMRYTVARTGQCIHPEEPAVQTDVAYHPESVQGRLRPRALARDIDLYAWRSFTDVVIQGTARVERPHTALAVTLECTAVRLAIEVHVTGDRQVERGPVGLRFSEPLPFTEMPMTYDRAYGGFDALADLRLGNPRVREFMATQLPDVVSRTSRFAYPRNPAGRGYVIDPDSAVGVSLPNIEFPGDALTPQRIVAPANEWTRRPYPAGFDWFAHAWFPRVGMIGVLPPTRDDESPEPETGLGILAAHAAGLPRSQRIRHELAQGAHPYLWRHRLRGDEQLRVTAMSTDGRDFQVHLPDHRPRIYIKQFTGPEEPAPVVLDAVFVETDLDRVTLVWRGTLPARKPGMQRGWERFCAHRVVW